jgi:hypothetical protein
LWYRDARKILFVGISLAYGRFQHMEFTDTTVFWQTSA